MSDEGSFGYGQQGPEDSNSDFQATEFLVRQLIAQMNTMKLVRVEAVHAGAGDGDVKAAGTVDVLPLVSQIDGGAHATPHGTVYGIPWSRVQGGKNAVVVDPEAGDIGYVVVSDRDISNVKAAKKPSNPGSFRKFDLADGVYVGGCLNVAPDQYLVFRSDGVRLVDKNGNSVATSPDGVTVTDKSGNVVSMAAGGISLTPVAGQPVTVNGVLVVTQGLKLGGAITAVDGETYAGNIQTTGAVVAGVGGPDQVNLETHTHGYLRPTGASTSAQTSAPTAGT